MNRKRNGSDGFPPGRNLNRSAPHRPGDVTNCCKHGGKRPNAQRPTTVFRLTATGSGYSLRAGPDIRFAFAVIGICINNATRDIEAQNCHGQTEGEHRSSGGSAHASFGRASARRTRLSGRKEIVGSGFGGACLLGSRRAEG